MKVYYHILSVLVMWFNPAVAQFFYHNPFQPIGNYYNNFLPQPFIHTFYNGPLVNPIQTAVPTNHYQTSFVTHNLPPIENNVQSAEFKGFGYHTNFKDGASSTVFFVTGAEADLLRNIKNLPDIKMNNNNNKDRSNNARNLASNSLDINEIPNIANHIQNILDPNEFKNLFRADNTVFNYYTYPASTAPLNPTIINKKLNDSNHNATEQTTTEVHTTTSSTTTESSSEFESVESRIQDVKTLPEDQSNSSTSSTTTTTSENTKTNDNETTEMSTMGEETTTQIQDNETTIKSD